MWKWLCSCFAWRFGVTRLVNEVHIGKAENDAVVWSATGNIRKECRFGPNGSDRRPGTKHFRGGAKVYVIDAYWGTCHTVTVVGHHRANGRYIKINMRAKHIENLSPKIVYSPKVVQLIREHFADRLNFATKEHAEQICSSVPNWSKEGG